MPQVREALSIILDSVSRLAPKRVALGESLGLVLADDVQAYDNVPPFASSAMDGYAVRADDVRSASPEGPRRLRVLQDVAAGQTAWQPVETGSAIRIMTGAQVPEGADCVVRVEDTRVDGDCVLILRGVRQGVNVRNAGEDLTTGQVVLRAGSVLRAAELGVLASVGCGMVPVIRPAKVAVVTTGDELADVSSPLGPGSIRDSNSYTLSAQARAAGASVVMFPRVRDAREAVREAMEAAAEQADLVITNGGVSVGDYDYVKLTLEAMGAELKFWGVNQKPGRPMAFWMLRGRPVASLPGYPVSAMVCFEEYVRPALRKMMGHALLHRPSRKAALEGGYSKTGDRRVHLVRVWAWEEEGRWKARLTGPQGSGILSSMAHANALGIIDGSEDEIADGGSIEIHLTDLPEDH